LKAQSAAGPHVRRPAPKPPPTLKFCRPAPKASSANRAQIAPRLHQKLAARPNIPLRYLAAPATISVKPPKSSSADRPKTATLAAAPFLQLSPNAPAQRPRAPAAPLPPIAHSCSRSQARSSASRQAAQRAGKSNLSGLNSFPPPAQIVISHERHHANFPPRTPENTGLPKLSPRKSPPPSQSAASFGDS
jgi:hypothetical protein